MTSLPFRLVQAQAEGGGVRLTRSTQASDAPARPSSKKPLQGAPIKGAAVGAPTGNQGTSTLPELSSNPFMRLNVDGRAPDMPFSFKEASGRGSHPVAQTKDLRKM